MGVGSSRMYGEWRKVCVSHNLVSFHFNPSVCSAQLTHFNVFCVLVFVLYLGKLVFVRRTKKPWERERERESSLRWCNNRIPLLAHVFAFERQQQLASATATAKKTILKFAFINYKYVWDAARFTLVHRVAESSFSSAAAHYAAAMMSWSNFAPKLIHYTSDIALHQPCGDMRSSPWPKTKP